MLMRFHATVFAAILMGDPRFVAGKSFDAGNSTTDGYIPRPANISCDSYTDRMRSYCDEGDYYCAGGNDKVIHNTYLDRYTTDALEFVNDKLCEPWLKAGKHQAGECCGVE